MSRVSHQSGPFKQKNKKHKKVPKRASEKSIKLTGNQKKVKILNKQERRFMAKQLRTRKSLELKNYAQLRGTHENPIACVLIPLCSTVPVKLATTLFKTCEPDIDHMGSALETTLQEAVHLRPQNLDKCFSLISANADDFFGCLDLAQYSDWIIVLVPSNLSDLSAKSFELLTALYAQGFTNISFAVLSSTVDLKEIRRMLEVRFPIPESVIHPLNTSANAVQLLRHIASNNSISKCGRLKDAQEAGPAALTNAAARYRARMLVDSISMIPEENSSEKSAKIFLRGRLKGAPLFLLEDLDQSSTVRVGPCIHLTGWGDFPLSEAIWITKDYTRSLWTVEDLKDGNDFQLAAPTIEMSSSFEEDSDSDPESGSMEAMETESESVQENLYPSSLDEDLIPKKTLKVTSNSTEQSDESDDDTHSLASHATRTMATTASSAFCSAQLARFRAARTEEMFPDEVETPPHVPARERFAKYRGLPRFQESAWPVEGDLLPSHYDNIACFKNYHRNRRTMLQYVRRRLAQSQGKHLSGNKNHQFIPSGVNVELIIKCVPLNIAKSIMSCHSDEITSLWDSYKNKKPHPLIVWSLLPHERNLSVCHFTMRRVVQALHATSDLIVIANEANKIAESNVSGAKDLSQFELGEEASTQIDREDKQIQDALITHQTTVDKRIRVSSIVDKDNPSLPPEAEPIKSKDLMLFQAGIRRFVATPIYSTITTSSKQKAKYEQFFSSQTPVTATVYAPVMYSPVNVLQFRIRVNQDDYGKLSPLYIGELVATGSLNSVDPNRLIIKRIFLSGHPYKIHQRHVVVRYMFFNPTDVQYFQSVELQTKNHAIGHIKESVGTHGHMKCVFDRHIQASDVVLMPLYKRVFPKHVYETQIFKSFKKETPSSTFTDLSYDDDDDSEDQVWRQSEDVIQLNKNKPKNKHNNEEISQTMNNNELALFV